MKEYRVRWEIDVTADSPQEAARIALAVQRDITSTALVFEVCDEGGHVDVIDLVKEDDDRYAE
jgi:hypothetical protein